MNKKTITMRDDLLPEAVKGLLRRIDHLNRIEKIGSETEAFEMLEEFNNCIAELELEMTRADIIRHITPLRGKVKDSWLLNRAQLWPRGYAGDFETIGYLLTGVNKTPPEAFGYYIESSFLHSDIVRQHQNKVINQSIHINQALERNGQANILSIGCGTCEDLMISKEKLSRSQASLTLVDIDIDALLYSKARLQATGSRIRTLQGNIYKIIHKLEEQYDLVLIGGVFDYCDDRHIIAILSTLDPLVRNSGRIFFTNIASGNSFRIVMEYLTDWILIERPYRSIVSLLQEAGMKHWRHEIKLDNTGLAWMVTLSK